MGRAFERCALEVVERAYRLDGPFEDWLAGLCSTAAPRFDHGFGVAAGVLEPGPAGGMRLSSTFATNGAMPSPVLHAMLAINRELSPPEGDAYRRAAPLATAGKVYEEAFRIRLGERAPYRAAHELGVRDWLVAQSVDPDGSGVGIFSPLPGPQSIDPREVALWGCALAHARAGLRLRTALEPADDAVLSPDGRVLHAEGDATRGGVREALRRSARDIDRARSGAGRRDPEAALASWKALVAGRWSLVDRFDHDGRRYLVARRNEPRVGRAQLLSERERQVAAHAAVGHSNKEIAYALGLSPSTVSSHLMRAIRRLGCGDRAGLAILFSSGAAGEGGER